MGGGIRPPALAKHAARRDLLYNSGPVSTNPDHEYHHPAPLKNHWRCPRCRYDLFGITGDPFRCPECGGTFSFLELAHANDRTAQPPRGAYATSAVVGLALWAALCLNPGAPEIWNDPMYWLFAAPAYLAANAVLGYLWPARPWRWSIVLLATQVLLIFSLAPSWAWGGLLGLVLPAWLCFSVALALLFVPCACLGAALRTFRS